MAKVKISDYVLTLKDIVAHSEGKSLESDFAGFLQLLRQNRQLDLIDQILLGLEQELARDRGQLLAVLHAQRQPSADQLGEIADFLRHRFAVDDIKWQIELDLDRPGVIVDANSERFDWSLAGQLERFKMNIQAA